MEGRPHTGAPFSFPAMRYGEAYNSRHRRAACDSSATRHRKLAATATLGAWPLHSHFAGYNVEGWVGKVMQGVAALTITFLLLAFNGMLGRED